MNKKIMMKYLNLKKEEIKRDIEIFLEGCPDRKEEVIFLSKRI